MKKIYLASLLLLSAGAVIAGNAQQIPNTKEKAGAPAKVTPDDPSNLSLKFGYEGDQPAIFISFKAPTREKSYYGEGAPLTTNLDKIEINRRVQGDWSWETVATFTNVFPGDLINYTDRDITEGATYEYNPVAFIGDDSSSTYNYASVYAGVRPDAPVLTGDSFKGSAPVTLTVTAPSTLEGGEPLETALTSIEIHRTIGYGDTRLLHTIGAPSKGETYEWVDDDYKNLTDGSEITYEAYARIGNFMSLPASIKVILRRDVPAIPETISLSQSDEGVEVSWTPVTTGRYGYWFDSETVTYNIYRITSGGSEKLLAEGLEECKYFDDLADIATRNSFCWKVAAANAEGEGYGIESDYLTIGRAPELPFKETFDTSGSYYPSADNLWTSEAIDGGYNRFNVTNNVMLWISGYYDTYIYACGNEDYTDKNAGFIALEGSNYTKTEAAYTSVGISRANDTKAKLTFNYYAIPKSKSILYVELVDPNEKPTEDDPFANATRLATISMNGQELGWEEYEIADIDISDLDEFQICFHGLTDPDDGRTGIITPICVDEITMTATQTDTSGITSPEASTGTATTYFTLTGMKLTDPKPGQIVIKVEQMTDGTTKATKIIY